MKRIHTEAKKANRGQRGDTPLEGLVITREKIKFGDKIILSDFIQHHTLVHPKGHKISFLRRNSLIKKEQ